KDRWRRRLDGLMREVELQRREVDDDDAQVVGLARRAADLAHLRDFALPVIERLAALPREASWSEWLDHLRALAGTALRHPEPVLAVLAELGPLGPVGPADLTAVQYVLAPRLRDLSVQPETRAAGCVFVAPVEMARGASFEIVFVPG